MFPTATTFAIIKACAFGAVLVVLYMWARGNGVDAERKRKAAAMAVCEADRATMAQSLNEVNAIAFTRKQDAAEQALKADHAVKAAEVDKADFIAHVEGISAQLDKAKQAPTCRAQLESELCVSLH
jgi:hypothetical protein